MLLHMHSHCWKHSKMASIVSPLFILQIKFIMSVVQPAKNENQVSVLDYPASHEQRMGPPSRTE